MAENSKIAWTTHTFNPWWGCTKVTRGCKHCYAETFSKRMGWSEKGRAKGKAPLWGPDGERKTMSDDYWSQPAKWERIAASTGEFTPVFSGSMCDVFEVHNAVQQIMDAQRLRLWSVIEATPHLTWLLLTKRPQHIMELIPARWGDRLPRNVWVGATMEDQKSLNERAPYLASVPAVVRFASIEPQVEDVDITPAVDAGVTWFISGGESGHHAAAYDPDWARSIIRQCRAHGVTPFIKQLGEVWGRKHTRLVPGTRSTTVNLLDATIRVPMVVMSREGTHGDIPELWDEDLQVREYPFGLELPGQIKPEQTTLQMDPMLALMAEAQCTA